MIKKYLLHCVNKAAKWNCKTEVGKSMSFDIVSSFSVVIEQNKFHC